MFNKLTTLLVLASILFTPFYIVRWSYLGQYPTTLLELMIMATVGFWLLGRVTERRPITFGFGKIAIPVILVLTSAVVAIFTAEDTWAALGLFRAYFLEPLLLLVVINDISLYFQDTALFSFRYRGKEYRFSFHQLLVYALVFTGVWLSLMGITQFFLHWPVINAHQSDRAHAVFNNGNALALFIGPVISFLLADLLKKTNAKTNWAQWFFENRVSLITFCTLITALVFTKSLGGMLAFVLTSIIIFGLTNRAKAQSNLKYLFPVIFVLFCIFLSQISSFVPQVTNPWMRPGGTASVRLCVWEGSRGLLQDHPIAGVGLRGFQTQYSENYTTCDAEPLMYPHNIFLNFWSELGLLGLIGFGWLFYLVMSAPLNKYSYSFVYLIWHGLVDVPYFKNDLAVIFWVLVALWMMEKRKQLQ